MYIATERAALLAKADEMQRQIKLQAALECAPALAVREPNVKEFLWPHGARELIAERKRVREIIVLRAKVERVYGLDHNGNQHDVLLGGFLGMPVSFHEAFVDSDIDRRTLMSRLDVLYGSQWKTDIVAVCLPSFPEHGSNGFRQFENRRAQWVEGMKPYYAMAPRLLAEHQESLLLIQAICAELKPETRELVTRCTNYEELDQSMVMQSLVKIEFR
jgi:hypothetical protein